MGRKLIFVNFYINSGWASGVNHGIAFLVPIARKHFYDVSCLDINREMADEEFRDRIEDLNPAIVGFSCISNQFKYLIRYSNAINKNAEVLQIAGGVGPTLDPELILSRTAVKGVCIGEGEVPLNNLLYNIDTGRDVNDTDGFYWNIDGQIKRNPIAPFISDLSEIDFPDYTVYGSDVIPPTGTLLIILSRGCPYRCSYCCNAALSSIYPLNGAYFRIPPVDYSIRMIEKIVSVYPNKEFIAFEDDLLMSNKNWIEDFAEQYSKRINLPYAINIRIENINPEIVGVLKSSGCKVVQLGLESGHECLRSKFLNRNYSNRLFIEKCKTVKDAGLKLFIYSIVGFPFEGRREMRDTFVLNKKLAPDDGVCTFFYPYKGTELYRICKQNNLLKNEEEMLEITNYNTRPAIKMSIAHEKECVYFQKKISDYLEKRRRLGQIKEACVHISPKIKRYIVFIYYWISLSLRKKQPLYRTLQQLSKLSGLRAIIIKWTE